MTQLQKDKDQSHEDLRKYRTLGLPLLILMGLLAALGIVITLILHYFF